MGPVPVATAVARALGESVRPLEAIAELKQEMHDGIEQWPLTDAEEAALLEEAPAGFRLNQKLLRALADLAPTPATA